MTPPRTSRFQCFAIVLLLFVAFGTQAESQTFTAAVGAGVNMEDGAGGSGRYGVRPGLSGRSATWDWLVGVNLARHVALVFEASLARPYAKEQFEVDRFERTHQDDNYSGTVHFRVHERFTLVGGVSRIHFETTALRYAVRRPTPATRIEEGPFHVPNHTGSSTGAVVGFDFLPLQWRFFRVGPAVRVFIYKHADEGQIPHFGYGHYAVRVGGRVQAQF